MSTYNYGQKPDEEELDDYTQELLEWQKIYAPREYLRAMQSGVVEYDPYWLGDMGYELDDPDDEWGSEDE